MDALDGNAIAGTMMTVFGTEMTTETGTCANCGTRSRVAEFGVYMRGPGVVVRCRTCDSVVMVLVEVHEIMCVDLRGLAALDPA